MAHGHHHYKDHNHRVPFNINNYGYSNLLRKDGTLRHGKPSSGSELIAEGQNKQPNVMSLGNPHVQKR